MRGGTGGGKGRGASLAPREITNLSWSCGSPDVSVGGVASIINPTITDRRSGNRLRRKSGSKDYVEGEGREREERWI